MTYAVCKFDEIIITPFRRGLQPAWRGPKSLKHFGEVGLVIFIWLLVEI